MSSRLRSAQEETMGSWRTIMLGDTARLRGYQRDLLTMRSLSPRPRISISLTLRQCAAARKMRGMAARALASCHLELQALSGGAK